MTDAHDPIGPSPSWHAWRDSAGLGLWSCLDSESAVASFTAAGFDYLAIDLQHGMLPPSAVHRIARVLRATPTTCVVRVAWNRPELVMQALDFGAELVVVPMVESAAEAAAAVHAASYPPDGARSWGPLWPDTARRPGDANAIVGCLAMVETRRGLDRVEEIAATPGLAGIYVGPNDLALGLGRGRATYSDDDVVHDALQSVANVCDRHGILAGLHCSSLEMARYWQPRGFQMLTIGTDTSLLSDAALALAARSRAEPAPVVRGY
ncbi:HpcH/HpaI aldolase family protein [Microbacterium allomyrinae]|uniref:Aldolase n=1 Tax=Microbacterium allomyrinae TaxID=2830666 RepID=A0A9X1S1D6_9MICO|nr:aldolase/citrate lyase family protein [Microbacterium allomyrinae]MCC2031571.1 aldolase [Microbacterium allomyrinae]